MDKTIKYVMATLCTMVIVMVLIIALLVCYPKEKEEPPYPRMSDTCGEYDTNWGGETNSTYWSISFVKDGGNSSKFALIQYSERKDIPYWDAWASKETGGHFNAEAYGDVNDRWHLWIEIKSSHDKNNLTYEQYEWYRCMLSS